jgi:hypothetical protein
MSYFDLRHSIFGHQLPKRLDPEERGKQVPSTKKVLRVFELTEWKILDYFSCF